MRRITIFLAAAALALALPGTAALADHPAPDFGGVNAPLAGGFNAGGEGAEWELVTTLFTGNPHSDLDFFTRDGDTYVAAGTLAVGGNAGGVTIMRLTEDGEVSPDFVTGHPSAACPSNPQAALALQHDVEATPKGDLGFNTATGEAGDTRDAQLIIDATDGAGRCHDSGDFGFGDAPQGGLEIIDITDLENPVEIGLTSHIGEAHTVNVDPKRPHIAYAVSSDGVAIVEDEDGNEKRDNENATTTNALGEEVANSQRFDLDGFEVVDLSSCMDFPADATVEEKRGVDEEGAFLDGEGCRPEVLRFRFELGWTRGTFDHDGQTGCHELELYPNDLLTCAAPNGTMVLDMSGAFDQNDRPRGTPLPCSVRESSSPSGFATGAPVTDCVVGEDEADLTVPGWLDMGAPSLDGVRLVGFVNHGGRDNGNFATHSPEEDIAVSHEAELTHSGRFVFASDERGGGVVPPDAACPTPGSQPAQGNGGLHAFRLDGLGTSYPAVRDDAGNIDAEATAERAREAYATTPEGEKAIYRATPRVPAASLCTAHVFQQIPGQNRIFMAWYTQGTQVVDYVEHPDGSFEWREVGFFIPENANTWTSAVFKMEENDDGTFTYWGATGDFNIGLAGRNAVDVYRVTLPAPAQMAAPEAPADEEPDPAPEPPADEQLPATGSNAPMGLAAVFAVLGALSLVALRRRSGA
ncbi:MAG: LPXTG cell wall anchor domain-containing protein [Nitriliruptorales bacterium]